MAYRIAICDDDEDILLPLSRMIRHEFERAGCCAAVSAFSGADSLLAAMESTLFDALFLDICMPGADGITLAGQLRTRSSDTPLVFLSGREDRVFDSFRAAPLRFVRKAHLKADLPEAVRTVVEVLQKANRVKLPLLTTHGMASVAVEDIMWVESFGKRQTLVLTTGALQVRHTLRELGQKLEPYGFLQVHRCYLVSCRYIFSIEACRLIMDNRQEIPISRYRLSACKEAFQRSISYGLDAAKRCPEEDL